MSYSLNLKKPGDTAYYTYIILDYQVVSTNPDLIIVTDGRIHEKKSFQINKAKFIAKCRFEGIDEKIHCLFYFDGFGYPMLVPLDLPEGFDNNSRADVFDYKSYSEVCELIGDEKLSLLDYISFAINNGGAFNYVEEINDEIVLMK